MAENQINRSGYVIPIGGGEDKTTGSKVLEKFVELCGGKDATIAIIPTASELSDTGDIYVEVFKKIGVKNAYNIRINDSRDAEDNKYLSELKEATGVFITGGNQRRLASILGGTPILRIIKDRNKSDKLHVAGTSAGAVFVCEYMLSAGESGLLPHEDMATLSQGLGLIDNIIVDQHFSQRDRLGRLLSALSTSPSSVQIGLGLDEDTAAFIAPNGQIEIVGNGRLTIVDMSNVEHAAINEDEKDKPIDLIGVTLHMLGDGNKFNITTKVAKPILECNLDIGENG